MRKLSVVDVNRKIKLIAMLLGSVGLAAVVQLLSVGLLGEKAIAIFHPALAFTVLTLGVSASVIFFGPGPLEVVIGEQRERAGGVVPIDAAYLRFTTDRTVRIVAVLMVSSILALATGYLTLERHLLVFVIVISIMVIAALRSIVISKRVRHHRFGTNEYEARVLLAFLRDLHRENLDVGAPPPGGIRKYKPVVALETIPEGAEYAK